MKQISAASYATARKPHARNLLFLSYVPEFPKFLEWGNCGAAPFHPCPSSVWNTYASLATTWCAFLSKVFVQMIHPANSSYKRMAFKIGKESQAHCDTLKSDLRNGQ